MARQIQLDEHDEALAELVRAMIDTAVRIAHRPSGVVKRITAKAVARRNRGRKAAMKRYPFAGKCEVSGRPLCREHADLDELDPVLGYNGPVRWVCKKANNSGTSTCGGC